MKLKEAYSWKKSYDKPRYWLNWLNWPELMGPHAMILVFWMLIFKPAFSLYSFTLIKWLFSTPFSSVQPLSCVQLCDLVDCSRLGFPGHHQLPESTQTHVHRVSDAIQPFYPPSSPFPPTFNISQIRVFSKESVLHIKWPNIGVSASASVLPMNIQDWFPLG